jgi:aerobic carbon-monoxide dehydrogenase medium subunit
MSSEEEYMKPAAFEYQRPASLSEALQALGRHGERAKILAGGQSLVPMMNLRLARCEVIVDINRIPGLDQIRADANTLAIGALARHTSVRESAVVAKHCPLLSEAYRHIAHLPIRNRGTIGGNISHADPASEVPAVLIATDATIVAKTAQGERNIAARDFFLGALQTALKPNEMVTEIRVPVAPANQGWAFEEESTRKGDFALAAVAATLTIAGGTCTQLALAAAGMGDRPVRLTALEALIKGKALDDALIKQAATLAKTSVNPDSSYHADANFRRDLVEALTERALRQARARCK